MLIGNPVLPFPGPQFRRLPVHESVLRLHCDVDHPGQLHLPRNDQAHRRGRVRKKRISTATSVTSAASASAAGPASATSLL